MLVVFAVETKGQYIDSQFESQFQTERKIPFIHTKSYYSCKITFVAHEIAAKISVFSNVALTTHDMPIRPGVKGGH